MERMAIEQSRHAGFQPASGEASGLAPAILDPEKNRLMARRSEITAPMPHDAGSVVTCRLEACVTVLLLFFGSALSWAAPAGLPPEAPVPKSPYLPIVYRYADTMLKHGRDTHGSVSNGMFLSALDRRALKPLTVRPTAPEGIREEDRAGEPSGPLTGINPQHDENLLRLLYTLRGLSGNIAYEQAADAELRWFLEHTASTNTHLLPWGEHMSWNALSDEPSPKDPRASHEFFRPWMLWDRCFDLAPRAALDFALALWDHQVANHRTGAFDRHADYWRHAPGEEHDFPRHAGFYIRTWSVAHTRSGDARTLEALETLLRRFESKWHPTTGLVEAHAGSKESWPTSTLSMAIDCEGAARLVPAPLAARLQTFAERADAAFCGLPHPLKKEGGFLAVVNTATGMPVGAPSPLWRARYGEQTTAQIGMMCVARYDNNGRPAYRDLLTAAADAYLGSSPPEGEDLWPGTLGQAISLELAAWRHTARWEYMQRAQALADWAVQHFWGDQPLPRASVKTDHYESITGADTLALALLELHLQILHITAVRCPPNTIDR